MASRPSRAVTSLELWTGGAGPDPPDKTVTDKLLVSLNQLKLKTKYNERGDGGGNSTAQAPHQNHTKNIYAKLASSVFFFKRQKLTRSTT